MTAPAGNEVLIIVQGEDRSGATRDATVAGWKQTAEQIKALPLVYGAQDGTGDVRERLLAEWAELRESFGPIEITAVNQTAQAAAQAAENIASVRDAAAEPLDITAVNDTAATVREVDAQLEALRADAAEPIALAVTNPVDQAWQTAIMAQIRALAKESLSIPVTADTADLRAQVGAELAAIKEFAAEPIPLQIANADEFKTSVEELLTEVRVEVAAGIPVPVTPTVSRLPASQVPNLTEYAPMSGTLPPSPTFTTAQYMGRSYAGASAAIESMPLPSEQLKVTATNPIDSAWIAQVKASLRSIAVDALDIPMTPDTAAFREQVEAQLVQMSDLEQLKIDLREGDSTRLREQVQATVSELQQQVKAVIQVSADSTPLMSLKQAALDAANADAQVTAAQEKLNQAIASGDPEAVAKAQQDVAAAEAQASESARALGEAQEAAGAGAGALADGEKAAATASRGLNDAMGPLWMIMNVAQMAMFAFSSTSSSTAASTQNLSQQIVSLGQATGSSASSMLVGNQALQKINTELGQIGSSSAQFAAAFSGSVAQATQYTTGLEAAQAQLGATLVTTTEHAATYDAQGNQNGQTSKTLSISVADLAHQVAGSASAYAALTPQVRAQVDAYNAYVDVVPQAKQQLAALVAQQQLEAAQLAAIGFTMTDQQQAINAYGSSLQTLYKDYQDATAGAKYLEDTADQAAITAGQGAQQWTQLQAAVTQARQAYVSAAEGVAAADHGVVTAEQGVASAQHGVQQAALAVKSAQQSYTESLYQEQQAQQAVTAARAAAEAQLISLKLQANDAATSVQSANLALFQAQQTAAAAGVTPGNAQAIAGEQITAANEKQVAAAVALLQAENQLADAQAASSTAQSSLNTARQQGVDNNPGVLSAEHALAQSQDQVQSAAQAVTDAQYQQQQAAIQLSNAQYGVQQAQLAVKSASEAEASALSALNTATDNASRSTDASTYAGAQNRQMLERLYDANVALYGPTQQAADITATEGQKMGFTNGQVQDVIGSLNGLSNKNVAFNLIGNPSLNLTAVGQQMAQMGFTTSQIISELGPTYNKPAKAAGGPGGGLTWVGEQGAELVNLAPGTNVTPHANAMGMVARGEITPPRRATGGPSTLARTLGDNAALATVWGLYAAVGDAGHAMGAPAMVLPPAGAIDLGAFGAPAVGAVAGAVSGLRNSAAANRAIVMQVFSSMFGWGSPAEQAATDYLEMRESGYNNVAQNPTSTAYGLFQFLNSTWAGYGIPKTSDPTQQTIAGGRYIAARYHDPIGAAAHERAYSWFGDGGIAGAGGWIGVGDRGPELLRVPAGSTVRPSVAGGAGTGGAAAQWMPVPAAQVTFDGGLDSGLASWFMKQIRTGKIQIHSRYIQAG